MLVGNTKKLNASGQVVLNPIHKKKGSIESESASEIYVDNFVL